METAVFVIGAVFKSVTVLVLASTAWVLLWWLLFALLHCLSLGRISGLRWSVASFLGTLSGVAHCILYVLFKYF